MALSDKPTSNAESGDGGGAKQVVGWAGGRRPAEGQTEPDGAEPERAEGGEGWAVAAGGGGGQRRAAAAGSDGRRRR